MKCNNHAYNIVLVIIVNSVFVIGNSLHCPNYVYIDNICTITKSYELHTPNTEMIHLYRYTESSVAYNIVVYQLLGRLWRPYIVFRNRFLYGFMFVYIYIYIYVYICQDGGAVGFR